MPPVPNTRAKSSSVTSLALARSNGIARAEQLAALADDLSLVAVLRDRCAPRPSPPTATGRSRPPTRPPTTGGNCAGRGLQCAERVLDRGEHRPGEPGCPPRPRGRLQLLLSLRHEAEQLVDRRRPRGARDQRIHGREMRGDGAAGLRSLRPPSILSSVPVACASLACRRCLQRAGRAAASADWCWHR